MSVFRRTFGKFSVVIIYLLLTSCTNAFPISTELKTTIKVKRIGDKKDKTELDFLHHEVVRKSVDNEKTKKMRLAIIWAIREIRSMDSLNVLSTLINENDVDIRIAAIAAYASIGKELAVETLVKKYETESSLRGQKAITSSLRRIGTQNSLSWLAFCFYQYDDSIKENLVLAELKHADEAYQKAVTAYKKGDAATLNALDAVGIAFLGKLLKKYPDRTLELLPMIGQVSVPIAMQIANEPAIQIERRTDRLANEERFAEAINSYRFLIVNLPEWERKLLIQQKLDTIIAANDRTLQGIDIEGDLRSRDQRYFEKRLRNAHLPKAVFSKMNPSTQKSKILYPFGLIKQARQVAGVLFLDPSSEYIREDSGSRIRVELGSQHRSNVEFERAKALYGEVFVVDLIGSSRKYRSPFFMRIKIVGRDLEGLPGYRLGVDAQEQPLLIVDAVSFSSGNLEVLAKIAERTLTGQDGRTFPVIRILQVK